MKKLFSNPVEVTPKPHKKAPTKSCLSIGAFIKNRGCAG